MSPARNSMRAIAKNAKVVLSQKESVLRAVSKEDYTRKHPQFLGSSVGGHVRHSLDHFSRILFCKGGASGIPIVEYDTRQRDTDIETDSAEALKEVQRQMVEIENVITKESESPVFVEHMCDPNTGEHCRMASTFGRELMFASHHALHHMFTVRLMMEEMSYSINNSDMGVANSTIKHEHEHDKCK
jgi:hypothetical protein